MVQVNWINPAGSGDPETFLNKGVTQSKWHSRKIFLAVNGRKTAEQKDQ